MRVLFTGASSFTGFWFVRELAAADHEIVMIFRCALDEYEGLRRSRVDRLLELGRPVFKCRFGDASFMELIEREPRWDLLCHHAAEVSNYKSPSFDVASAVRGNTLNVREVLAALIARGCPKVLLTGSVFENGEGAGSDGLRAFSPYGLSKAFTSQVFAYHAQIQGLRLGKFVIPNPFGPYEEPRFLGYLMRSWLEGETPAVRTPDYVRDNIHVSQLARAYVECASTLPFSPGFQKINPSGYVESQGIFARRVAEQMRERLGLPCDVRLQRQTDFAEPRVRINTDPLDAAQLAWNETRAWDELAEYYERHSAEELTPRRERGACT